MSPPILNILYLNHPQDTEKSAIRAIPSDKTLNELVRYYLELLGESQRQLARTFGVNTTSIANWMGKNPKYKDGHPVPLWVLIELQTRCALTQAQLIELINSVDALRCGRTGKVCKFPRTLTPELAWFVGAHAADGSLSLKHNRSAMTAKWDLFDSYKDNAERIQQLANELFGLNLELKQKNNAWGLFTQAQIIARVLHRLFDMPIGRKCDTVSEPSIISNETDERLLTNKGDAYWKIRAAFVRGVMTFDGHCTVSGGTPCVGIGVNSDSLRESLCEIFSHHGITLRNYPNCRRATTTRIRDAQAMLDFEVFHGEKLQKLNRLLER